MVTITSFKADISGISPLSSLWQSADAWNASQHVSFETLYDGQFTLSTQLTKSKLSSYGQNMPLDTLRDILCKLVQPKGELPRVQFFPGIDWLIITYLCFQLVSFLALCHVWHGKTLDHGPYRNKLDGLKAYKPITLEDLRFLPAVMLQKRWTLFAIDFFDPRTACIIKYGVTRKPYRCCQNFL